LEEKVKRYPFCFLSPQIIHRIHRVKYNSLSSCNLRVIQRWGILTHIYKRRAKCLKLRKFLLYPFGFFEKILSSRIAQKVKKAIPSEEKEE